jgi:WD40 repeat protein
MKKNIPYNVKQLINKYRNNIYVVSITKHRSRINTTVFSPDEKFIVAGYEDGNIKIWDIDLMQCVKTLVNNKKPISDIRYLHNNTLVSSNETTNILVASLENIIEIWDVNSGKCINVFIDKDVIDIFEFSYNREIIATGTVLGAIKLWDVNSGQYIKTLDNSNEQIISIAFSIDQKNIASSYGDGTIKIWDFISCQCIKELRFHNNRWANIVVSFSSDGKTIKGVCENEITIWNIESGIILFSTKLYNYSDAFVDDVLYQFDKRSYIKIYDTISGQYNEILIKDKSIFDFVISNNKKIIVLFYHGGTIQLIDVEHGKCIKTIYKYISTVATQPTVSFSSNNIIFGYEDGTITICERF